MGGPPIYLLHGAGLNHLAFEPLRERLGHVDLRILSLPGRCGVPGPPARTVAEAAAHVLGRLDADGAQRAVLAGYSYGGAISIELALTAPERVSGLVLLATGARLHVHPMILDCIDVAVERGVSAWFGGIAFLPGTDRAITQQVADAAAHTPAETARADWRACDLYDRTADVHRIRAPTRVVSGDQDTLTRPKYARFLADQIPGAEQVLLEGAGHMFPFERPGDVVAALRAPPGCPAPVE